MKLLPYFVVAGGLVLGLIASIVTGDVLILLVVAIVAIVYVLLMRSRVGGRDQTPEERLTSDVPRRARR